MQIEEVREIEAINLLEEAKRQYQNNQKKKKTRLMKKRK
jgi:hypothetical protein